MALNPVSFTEQVVSDFLRYQLTTYPLADTDLYAQMRALLRLEETRSTPLRRGPFVSLSRPFKQGASIVDLVKDGVLHSAMEGIATYASVRAHQEQAIRAIRKGETTLIATGTGSGKTEAFLYPIISRCLDLHDAGAPPGVLAVLVYPMNALAEDQLERLRGLLAGRGITFGMYVGKTPEEEAGVRGERLKPGSSNEDYHARLAQIRKENLTISLLPPEERASRTAMRKEGGQPRILLTNAKQLELLLTRGKDIGIFAGAPIEFLVFDEAHTCRGAQGAEIACLIRRLRTFCGKSADQVTCVATSATLADPERGPDAARDFARRFFGVDAASVALIGEVYDELRWNEFRAVPAGSPADPMGTLTRLLDAVDAPDDTVAEAISDCLLDLGGARLPHAGWQEALASQMASNELVYRISDLLRTPRELANLAPALAEVVGREVPEAEILCWLALGAACGRNGHDPVLRPVVHTFIRGVGGAVVTFSAPGGVARLWLAGEDAEAELGDGWRLFPVITCTTCGQHYYETWVKDFRLRAGVKAGPGGGDLMGANQVWPHLAEELGGVRVLLVDRLVVRPDEDDESEEVDEDGDPVPPTGHDYDHRRLHPLWACARCGALQAVADSACASCQAQGSLVAVQVVRQKEDLPGQIHSCVACQAPGKRPFGGRYREPARPIRAQGVSDVHVLAQSIIHLTTRPPRLLVFADNRQEAAFQAGWMQDHARRYRLRSFMAQQIPPAGASVGDVAQGLDALLEKDRDLSRALIPEVWKVAHQEDAGSKHREERLYFLRLQVMREVATGVKQRLGLEPWGRLKVRYLGLNPDLPFVRTWADRLSVEPADLMEGIGALLDHHRRTRILHDPTTHVFETFWTSKDKEIQYGYLPIFGGGPRGLKLRRGAEDLPARATQWVGSHPTQVWNAVSGWGVPEPEIEDFLTGLWDMLRAEKILVPADLKGWGKALKGSAGTCQIDSRRILLVPHRGRWRCARCRRSTIRKGPHDLCLAWRCGGTLAWEEEDPDDFDLHVLAGDYEMLRVAEHSAQVPHATRERIEQQFKGEGDQLNTLVCTPTLELGVDIGALDAVLMRNVPPTPANYWQRAGRAGRRHRMAVDVTYAQATGFDQAHFRDPAKLLGGMVEPPRFNLKNEVMVRKHVHAAVLTALHGVARQTPTARERIDEVLRRCFPPTLRAYLFTPGGDVLEKVLDVSDLGVLIAEHRPAVLAEVRRAFTQSWPPEDAAAVVVSQIEWMVDNMHLSLAEVLRRFKRRLDWARGELTRLAKEEAKKGELDPEDKAHRKRCERMIGRLKGTVIRSRASAEGGPDDSETMGALAREGFLPGYGLESGNIVGTAEPPRLTEGLDDFELPRPPALALREYVPGNAIYANGFRFVPRRYQLTPENTLRFSILVENHAILEVGTDTPTAPLSLHEIRAVPICDVTMPSQSQISDEEEFRFQMPVSLYAADRGYHRGGTAWTWAGLDIRFRRGVQLRMLDAGPRKEVEQARPGFPLCLACGQSISPFSSRKAQEEFQRLHRERCGHEVRPTGFYADVEVDLLGLHDIEDRKLAFSLAESLRRGAARVLDMEVEDLQILAIGHPGESRMDVFLYDPMPGGSGLLEQLTERWDEVRRAALVLLEGCPGACEHACIDCLKTYRNRFYHEHLDRHRALGVLGSASGSLVEVYPIPENLPKTSTTTGQTQTSIEARFKRFLAEAGLPAPVCQHRIDLGAGYGPTIPDFFYSDPDGVEPGLCVYSDGMGRFIHGNEDQATKDRILRDRLESLGYEVVVVRSFELDDKAAVVRAISRIAKYIAGKEEQRRVREDSSWYERASIPTTPGPVAAPMPPVMGRPHLRLIRCEPEASGAIPIYDLRIAAGAFSEGQAPETTGWAAVEGAPHRPGLFVAQVQGDSMDRIVPSGSWCLWQHVGAPEAPAVADGEDIVVRRPDGPDAELGQFTFKRLTSTPEGRFLEPMTRNPAYVPIRLSPLHEVHAVARFLCVLGSE